MEILLLGLAGLGGLALLLQQKPLPSREDAEKAFAVLEKNPVDPDANTVAGKYKAFVMGDYDGAMPYLVHSKDTTLKTLAEHELDATRTTTAPQKVGMGDEWVAAAKKFPALSRIFYDRASQWYIKGWPDLDNVWKERSRIQGLKLAAARPPGGAAKALPNGWSGDQVVPGMKIPVLDGTISHTASYSVKMIPADEKVKGVFSQLNSDAIAIPPRSKEAEFSAWVMSNGTENPNDRVVLFFLDKSLHPVSIPLDTPFWNRVSAKVVIPEGTTGAMLGVVQASKKGNVWVDDASVKIDGKEVLKSPSFE